ncbi:ABC transporter ATP-binding protein [Treponema bryantii]|uniref:ABC transporter ATP-binding protein n=1 Tax=Treponema bryantii TaxID=163 RepID=UPI0003B6643B|nr:ABC transporter ATP-binding protein [Treponema bryantii]
MKEKKFKSRIRAVQNNFFALRLVWKMCPGPVVHMAIARLLYYFGWLFYSAFFMRYVINALQTGETFKAIMIFIGITVAVFASMALYNSFIQGYVAPLANASLNKQLYQKLFKKARNVELECFENSDFYDKYTLAMKNADTNLYNTVDQLFGLLFGFVASICAFIFMFKVDSFSVAFILLPIIGNFYFRILNSRIDYQRNKEMAPHNRRIDYINRIMYLKDYAKEIRLTNIFNLLKRQYTEAITGVADVTKKFVLKSAFLHWFYVMFTFTFIFEGLLIYGAYRTLVSNTMTLPQLAVLTSMMVSTTWILIGFTDSVTASFKNGLFVDYLRTFLEYEEKIPEDYDGTDPGKTIDSIEFRNVCFAYKDAPVLSNLNMKFEGGKTYALVGHNGAGKSTIIKLLLRFYDPTQGEILLNGHNIKEYNLQKYRALFATAFQDNRMFSMSVADNVTLGEDIPAEKREAIVTEALKLSGVYEKVMSLPQGINTTLTREFDDQGAVLSGGEFQKIVVSRAFARTCPVKVFDEPSSALDPIAEYQLFDNILKACKENTLLFISHRLSSVQNADHVFLLEHGQVKEEGSHRELMDRHGLYADMYQKQAENYLADKSKQKEGIWA